MATRKRRATALGDDDVHPKNTKKKKPNDATTAPKAPPGLHDVEKFFSDESRALSAACAPLPPYRAQSDPAGKRQLPDPNIDPKVATDRALSGTAFRLCIRGDDPAHPISADDIARVVAAIPVGDSALAQTTIHGSVGFGAKHGKTPPNATFVTEIFLTDAQRKALLRQSDLSRLLYNDCAVGFLTAIAPDLSRGAVWTLQQKQYFTERGKNRGVPRYKTLADLYKASGRALRDGLRELGFEPMPVEHEDILYKDAADSGKHIDATLVQSTIRDIVAAFEANYAKAIHAKNKVAEVKGKVAAWKAAGKRTRRPRKRQRKNFTLKPRTKKAKTCTLKLVAQQHGRVVKRVVKVTDEVTGEVRSEVASEVQRGNGGLFGVWGHCFADIKTRVPLASDLFLADENGWICPKFDYQLVFRKTPLLRFELHLKRTQDSTDADGRGVVSLDPGVREFLEGYDVLTGQLLELGHGDGEGTQQHLVRLLVKADRNKARAAAVERDESLPKRLRRLRSRTLRARAATLYRKVTQKVADLHRRLARFLCERYAVIIIPKFETSTMVARKRENSSGSVKRRLITKATARMMNALSFYKFRERLLHTASLTGTRVEVCGEAYTTKTCSDCGTIKANIGGNKRFRCPDVACGLDVSRDGNGAKNIFLRYVTCLADAGQMAELQAALQRSRGIAPRAHSAQSPGTRAANPASSGGLGRKTKSP